MKPLTQAIWKQGSLAVAIASGVFLILMGGLLLFNQAQGKVGRLVKSTELVRLHDELRQRPQDEALKQRIRKLDLQLRQNSFTELRISHNGTRAMILVTALFLASAHLARKQRRKLPDPLAWGPRRPAEENRSRLVTQYAVAALFGAAAVAAVGTSLQAVRLPPPPVAAPVAAIRFPTAAELRENWPAFRGFDGSGYREVSAVPATWNLKTGQGVRWKTEVPLPGMSSPIRWTNALFLTGANAQSNVVYRFDADSGKLVWATTLRPPGSKMPGPKVMEDTGLAAPTPVTDGQRIYVIFANAEVAALDFSGKQIWCRNLGPLDNLYGHASSLAIYQDRLLVQLDQSEAASKLIALNAGTGQELWQTPRPIVCSWASPIVVEAAGKPQLVTCGQPWVIGYNPLDGAELWRVNGLDSSELAPSPVCAGGKVIASNPGGAVLAIRPDGQGDVTAANVAWKTVSGVPSVSSPASDGKRLYLLTGEGQFTCLDPATGQVKWSHDFADEFYSSPVIGGGRVLIVTRKGVAHVVENADQFRELGKSELGEDCNATPVPDRQCLYLRGGKHLFCLTESAPVAVNRPKD
ncbi:MAG: PQQ-binding-like beta-propeller repeat protein [Verrucomicrobiota bacterium]